MNHQRLMLLGAEPLGEPTTSAIDRATRGLRGDRGRPGAERRVAGYRDPPAASWPTREMVHGFPTSPGPSYGRWPSTRRSTGCRAAAGDSIIGSPPRAPSNATLARLAWGPRHGPDPEGRWDAPAGDRGSIPTVIYLKAKIVELLRSDVDVHGSPPSPPARPHLLRLAARFVSTISTPPPGAAALEPDRRARTSAQRKCTRSHMGCACVVRPQTTSPIAWICRRAPPQPPHRPHRPRPRRRRRRQPADAPLSLQK